MHKTIGNFGLLELGLQKIFLQNPCALSPLSPVMVNAYTSDAATRFVTCISVGTGKQNAANAASFGSSLSFAYFNPTRAVAAVVGWR